MKKLLTLSMICVGSFAFSQQTTIYTNSPNYQQLKSQNLLGNYNVLSTPNSGVPQQPVRYNGSEGNRANAACDCMVALDSTFFVVPMVGGVAPDYRNDDQSSAAIALPFTFCLYGSSYDTVYINNNGNVSFGSPYFTFTSDSFPSSNYTMVAPFWGDVDTRDSASGLVYYKITPTSLIVRWDHVGYFPVMSDKLTDFQLMITDGTDPSLPIGTNVGYCYADMDWTTGSASGGVGGFGGTPSTVGANEGDGVSFIQMGRFGDSTNVYDGPYGIADGVDWLDDQQFYFNSCTDTASTNVDPILVTDMCDTINLLPGDTIQYQMMVIAGEQFQSVITNFDLGTYTDYTVNTSQNVGFSYYILSLNIPTTFTGNININITATDNGTPAASTMRHYTIVTPASTSGIKNNFSNKISIYPNPSKDNFIVSGLSQGKNIINVLDVSGRVVKQVINENKNQQTIITNDLSDGIYTVQINSGGNITYTKVIVAK